MRQGKADPSSEDYLNIEALLNNIKRIGINSETEYALACAIVDVSGNLITTLPVSLASLPQAPGSSFANITSNGTAVVKSGAGVIRSIMVNGLGNASTAVLYDNTVGSGTKIGTIATATSLVPFVFNCKFTTGLTIVTAGVVAADLTIIYD